MQESRLKSFNYAIGMFGTSIPINMLKTYAAIYYVDRLGLTTLQLASILLIYTFIDALDNPVYGFLSDRTRTTLGSPPALAGDRHAAAGAGLHRILFHRRLSWRQFAVCLCHVVLHPDRHAGFGHQRQLRCALPGTLPHGCQPGLHQCPAPGLPTGGDDHQHRPDPDGHQGAWATA